jgi:hypothetical protein
MSSILRRYSLKPITYNYVRSLLTSDYSTSANRLSCLLGTASSVNFSNSGASTILMIYPLAIISLLSISRICLLRLSRES